jgi:hypothetical protein
MSLASSFLIIVTYLEKYSYNDDIFCTDMYAFDERGHLAAFSPPYERICPTFCDTD